MITTAELTYDLSQTQKALNDYAALTTKTGNEVIVKQSNEFSFNLSRKLREIAPSKGSVRVERIAALKAGKGVHVRPAVLEEIATKYQAVVSVASRKTYLVQRRGKNGRGKPVAMGTEIEKNGKRMNLQALAVERELNLRESARGFSGHAVPRGYGDVESSVAFETESRYGFTLSSLDLTLGPRVQVAEMTWFDAVEDGYETAVAGLSKPKQMEILSQALRATESNMREYIERKQAENAAKSKLN